MDAELINHCEKLFLSKLLYSCSNTREAVLALYKAVPEVSRLDVERLVLVFEKKLTVAMERK
jgi:hypothetical protein